MSKTGWVEGFKNKMRIIIGTKNVLLNRKSMNSAFIKESKFVLKSNF